MNATPLEKVLTAIGDYKKSGKSFKARCPAHEDNSPSLSVSAGGDGTVLVKCHAGCTTENVVRALDLEMRDLFPHVDTTPRNTKKKEGSSTPKGKTRVFPTAAIAVAELEKRLGKRTAWWTYADAGGDPVAVVVRWDKGDGKTFRPVAKIDGGWGIGDPADPWPLYRLPELLQSTARVYVVEGEKAADALRALGFTVTTSAHGAKSAKGTDWSPLAGRDVVILPDNDDAGTGYAETVTCLLCKLDSRPSIKIVNLPGLPAGGDVVEFITARRAAGLDDTVIRAEIETMAYKAKAIQQEESAPAEGDPRTETRAEIMITTEEHIVNTSAVEALVNDTAIYQRGGILVRIVRDGSPASKGIRRPLAPRIEPLPAPILRERLTAVARWKKIHETNEGIQEKPAHPPAWCVSAVHARGDWPGIRHLESIVEYPVLRPDGTILIRNGYDPDTGLVLENTCEIGEPPEHPTRDDAIAARDQLLDVVTDFPFERSVHRAAWLAGLLTPLSRFAFRGPAPLFLVDANVRAAGKGLLLDCISRIITGERFTIATYTQDEDELRKRITSLAISGERLVLFDNLDGKFGNATLDAALTGTSWEDRLLGVNRMARAPLNMTWYATGNNVLIGADTARRVCHVRLESDHERPEERDGFRHPDLLAFIGSNRTDLLRAALTMLRAYVVEGRPDMKLAAWGSFDGWSRLVRAAVVWIGLPDPGETRIQLQDSADTAAESMGLLLNSWEAMDANHCGLTTSEVIDRLRNSENRGEIEENCRAAIESLVGKLDPRALGYKLRQYRRRIFHGKFFDRAGTSHQAIRWAVFGHAEFSSVKDPPHPHRPPLLAGGWEDGEDDSPQAESPKPTDEWGES